MIEVRDKSNPDRLLGHLTERPLARLEGRMLCMPIYKHCSPMTYMGMPISDTLSDVTRVMFDVSYRTIDGGYTRVAELHTSTPLDDLMHLRTFRLPGESPAAMYYRQCIQRNSF